ncbi:MAG: helix-turn-helix transcriptional regulator [Ancalomicrobiaceae bacterium]|nr:helix-turn-helix transcriptional regulator [Ancalomicrobiaceae bacterium]
MLDQTGKPNAANLLGDYLRDRRTRLDPAALGLSLTRRRTPGLRREEVAQRANVSATWYTWLEQGRGGAPSAHVLDRIAKALLLTEAEREHLFLIALGRPPEVRYQSTDGITPRLQRVLDALTFSPAYIKTSTWDLVAWNRAAEVVLSPYGDIAPENRNLIRHIFLGGQTRQKMAHWEDNARAVVALFRAEVARAGAAERVQPFVADLCDKSPDFARFWAENDVSQSYGEIAKTVNHPDAGPILLDYSSFSVDGRPDLDLVIYNPATDEDREKVKGLVEGGKAE